MSLAIIVGGAECVWDDLTEARNMCAACGLAYQLFITNDMIEKFPEVAIGVTLHPDKLAKWLENRRNNNFPTLTEMWAHRSHRLVQKQTKDWGGSVGLFAYKVAHEKGHGRIVVCGVPMSPDKKHFIRHDMWRACIPFRGAWTRHKAEIAPNIRSMSGWTADEFGKPDRAWLMG